MLEFDRAGLEDAGFRGFVRFSGLNHADVPATGGVYAVLRDARMKPVFLSANPGGRFKGKDPTVDPARLAARWIEGCSVIYIGKATKLQTRLEQYRDFGSGRPVGHWGGRFIWQMERANEHVVCWKATHENPRDAEIALLSRFRKAHGRLPYANIKS